MQYLILGLQVIFIGTCYVSGQVLPIVTLNQGLISGISDVDINGGIFYKFFGIPYAKAPVGSLRFKAPQPPDSWSLIRNGAVEGSACMAADRSSIDKVVGAEDCLFLNVYTKVLPSLISNKKRSVMVFIPGGAFTLGSSTESLYGAHYLMTQDIVLVTINYRLGVLGFLSSDDLSLDVPGNAGLKDQTAALKWVQENIAKFNGDPNDVTLFGISAGGASVSLQQLSPTATGLFHKAISQSGNALDPWVWGSKNAIRVAEILGYTPTTDQEALQILMNASGNDVVNASLKIRDEVMNSNKRRPFGVVIEKPNPTAFLTEDPTYLLSTGKYNQMPTIQGVVSSEGMLYRYYHMQAPFTLENETLLPWPLRPQTDNATVQSVEDKIKEFYFSNGYDDEQCYNFISDVDFVCGAVESTRLMSQTSSQPVYMYVYSAEVSFSNMMRSIYGVKNDSISGVGHGGDQMILFRTILVPLMLVPVTKTSIEAVEQLVELWTDFAETGIPSVKWEAVTDQDNLNYFNIDLNSTLRVNPFAERVAFWRNTFSQPPNFYS